VLIVACANVAGLLASRAPARAREIALRQAVGAGRLRLVRQLVTESLLIAVGGGAVGLAIAYGGIQLFRKIEFPTEVPLKLFFELDRRVLVTGLAVATLSAVISSLIPAWQTARADLVAVIKGPGQSRRARQWGRQSLVCLQVALALVLLTVAVGMYSGFALRILQGPGFRTERILMARFDTQLAGYDNDKALQVHRLLKDRVRAIPGVESVAITSAVPFKTDTTEFFRVAPEGVRLPDDAGFVRTRSSRIDEGFFDTFGIPIVEGRQFTAADDGVAAHVAIVSRTFASHYWPGASALGRRVRVFGAGDAREWFEIVGVAADAKQDWLGETPQDFIYLPRAQNPAPASTLLIATDRDAAAVAAPLREAVRQIDANLPLFSVRTIEDLYESRGLLVPTVIIQTVGGMGMMGLILALVGLYGLVSHAVSRRVKEFGIRMAVGAAPSSILHMVLLRSVLLTCAGITLGLLGSMASRQLIEAAFPGVGGAGIATYAMVLPAVFAVALLAAYLPARRASRTDPLRALRVE
jgi:predicted permease